MRDPEIVSAERFGDATMAALFTRGYTGYYVDVTLDAVAFTGMAATQNLARAASRVAVIDGVPVGFAMLGVRGTRGWIGGMGVAPEARGLRLGERLMRAAIESARDLRLTDVTLEVLVQNAHVASLYERLGFRDTRALEVLTRTGAFAADAPGPVAPEPITPQEVFADWDALHAEPPPWQRDRPALAHRAADLVGLGVRESGRVLAAALFIANPARGVIDDVVVRTPAHAPLLDAAIAAALARAPEAPWTLLNLPAAHPARASLLARGFTARHTQREMRLVL